MIPDIHIRFFNLLDFSKINLLDFLLFYTPVQETDAFEFEIYAYLSLKVHILIRQFCHRALGLFDEYTFYPATSSFESF